MFDICVYVCVCVYVYVYVCVCLCVYVLLPLLAELWCDLESHTSPTLNPTPPQIQEDLEFHIQIPLPWLY